MYSDVPCSPGPCVYTASPTVSVPHQSSTFARIDEPTWTHHYHSEFIADISVPCWCVDKWVMTYTYHYSITRSLFTALKILSARRGFLSIDKTLACSSARVGLRVGSWGDRVSSESVRDGARPKGGQMGWEWSMA